MLGESEETAGEGCAGLLFAIPPVAGYVSLAGRWRCLDVPRMPQRRVNGSDVIVVCTQRDVDHQRTGDDRAFVLVFCEVKWWVNRDNAPQRTMCLHIGKLLTASREEIRSHDSESVNVDRIMT